MSSNNDLMLDVSQAAELKLAFRRNGWNNAEIKTLSEGSILADVLRVIKGKAKIKNLYNYLIDCNTDPFVPEGWSVEEHKKGGFFKFSPRRIELYLTVRQRSDLFNGYEIRKRLKDKQVINANVLDYLVAHPKLIPEVWKKYAIFFWGTIYRHSGHLYVRYLGWNGCGWSWDYHWLVGDFYFDDPAAIFI